MNCPRCNNQMYLKYEDEVIVIYACEKCYKIIEFVKRCDVE